MKIRLLSYRIANLRSFRDLNIRLHEKKITLIMMPNGTGKTTSIDLIKCAISGELRDKKFIRTFKPNFVTAESSRFELRLSVDDEYYTIKIEFDFFENTVKFYYTDTNSGKEIKRPLEFGVFTEEFVEKFIFDGELAKEFLNSESAYAEQSVKNLYHLEKLEQLNSKIDYVKNLLISESDMTQASNVSGLTRHTRELEKFVNAYEELVHEEKELKKKINEFDTEISSIQSSVDLLYSSNQSIQDSIEKHTIEMNKLSSEKNKLVDQLSLNMLFVHNISERMWVENKELIDILVQMKLPKAVSEQFFIDLIKHAQTCICGRPMEQESRRYLEENYHKYLEENNISILNEIKSYALQITFSKDLDFKILKLHEFEKDYKRESQKLERAKDRIDNEQKEKKEQLEQKKKELIAECERFKTRHEIITCEDDYQISNYKDEDNIKKLKSKIESLRKIIDQVERNRMINYNAEILNGLINEAKTRLLLKIKENVLHLTNDKVKKIIQNDNIEIESIDKYIKIKNRDGVSVGQSLSVSYSFISALFENSFYDLPFVIDSPAGSLDNDYRAEVSRIIPRVFDQLVMFVISSEKPYFADIISQNYPNNVKYYTIYKDNGEIVSDDSKEVFDSFQDRSDVYV